jgi:DNA-binding LytR/AlgR family response regulator
MVKRIPQKSISNMSQNSPILRTLFQSAKNPYTFTSMENDDSDPRPVSIVLVDDDSAFADEMRRTLARCSDATGEKHTFTAYPDAEAFWREYGSPRPDIVFFDIQLPGESGLDTARKLFRRDKRTAIVFVTANPDFAVQGYGVNALGFLVKPPAESALRELLAAARERLHPPAATLTVRTACGVRVLRLDAVTYLESRNRRVFFHGCGGDAVCVATLAEFQPKLPPGFLQVHKSFIVNLDRSLALRRTEVLMDDGTELPISKSCRKQTAEIFFARLADEAKGRACGM